MAGKFPVTTNMEENDMAPEIRAPFLAARTPPADQEVDLLQTLRGVLGNLSVMYAEENVEAMQTYHREHNLTPEQWDVLKRNSNVNLAHHFRLADESQYPEVLSDALTDPVRQVASSVLFAIAVLEHAPDKNGLPLNLRHVSEVPRRVADLEAGIFGLSRKNLEAGGHANARDVDRDVDPFLAFMTTLYRKVLPELDRQSEALARCHGHRFTSGTSDPAMVGSTFMKRPIFSTPRFARLPHGEGSEPSQTAL